MKKRRISMGCVAVLLMLGALPAQSEIVDDFPEVVIFATNSIDVGSNSTVHSGDVVANNDNGGVELGIGNKATFPAGWEVKADTVDLMNFINFNGSLVCNDGDALCSAGSLSTPVYGQLPIFQSPGAGTVPFDVPQSSSAVITPGDHGDVTVGLEGTITFQGPGVFNIGSFTSGRKAQIDIAGGPVEIRVHGDMNTGVEDNIGLNAGAPAASDVIFYVTGNASLGDKTTIKANFFVAGLLQLGSNVTGYGAFHATDVVVGQKGQFTLATFFDYPPAATDDDATTLEDNAVVIGVLANDIDPEGDDTFVNGFTQGSVGTVACTGGGAPPCAVGDTLTYTPDANYFGPDSFTYEVCDVDTQINADNCAEATVSVTVTSVNDPPTANDDDASTAEDTPVTVSVLGNDNAGPPNELPTLTVSGVTQGTNGSVAFTTGDVTYTPNPDFFGSDTFTYSACDSGDGADDPGSLCDTATVSVTVTSVNDAPDAVDDIASTDEDVAGTFNVLGNDNAGPANELQTLTITEVTQGTNGAVSFTAGDVTYTPSQDFFGADSFTYKACDSGDGADDNTSLCDTATVSVTVNPVNDPPVTNDQTVETDNETPVVITMIGSDVEGDSLTFTPLTTPALGSLGPFVSLGPTSAQVTFTPTGGGTTGTTSFNFQVADGNGGTATGKVTIIVTAFNNPPVANPQSIGTDGATSVNITLTAADLEDPLLDYSLVSGPGAGTLSGLPQNGVASAAVTYSPNNPTNNDPDSFVFQACDGGTPSKCGFAAITINSDEPLNNPPTANDQAVATSGDVNLQIILTGSDPDGDSLTFTILINVPPASTCEEGPGPCNGTVGALTQIPPTSASVVYNPATGDDLADKITFRVCDGGTPELCDTGTVSINGGLETPNDPPQPLADRIKLAPGGTATTLIDGVTTSLLANDTDPNGDSLTVTTTPVSGPSAGTVTLAGDGTFSYTNTDTLATTDQFVYEACDDGSPQECATATVFIQIVPDTINVTLDIVFLGSDIETSTGTVISTPAGFSCSTASCGTVSFDTSSPIVLATEAGAGSIFAGWGASADPDCFDGNLVPNADKSCTATFDLYTPPTGDPVTVTVINAGGGVVVSDPPGISCDGPSGDCSEVFQDTRVALLPREAPGFTFAGFSGDADCSDGELDGTADVECIATFEALPPDLRALTVVTGGTGSGAVSRKPLGIACDPEVESCTAKYPDGTTVVLNARPDFGSTFSGWSGNCGSMSGFEATIVMGSDATCTATFDSAGQ